jgi:hypothetical protein
MQREIHILDAFLCLASCSLLLEATCIDVLLLEADC